MADQQLKKYDIAKDWVKLKDFYKALCDIVDDPASLFASEQEEAQIDDNVAKLEALNQSHMVSMGLQNNNNVVLTQVRPSALQLHTLLQRNIEKLQPNAASFVQKIADKVLVQEFKNAFATYDKENVDQNVKNYYQQVNDAIMARQEWEGSKQTPEAKASPFLDEEWRKTLVAAITWLGEHKLAAPPAPPSATKQNWLAPPKPAAAAVTMNGEALAHLQSGGRK